MPEVAGVFLFLKESVKERLNCANSTFDSRDGTLLETAEARAVQFAYLLYFLCRIITSMLGNALVDCVITLTCILPLIDTVVAAINLQLLCQRAQIGYC